MGRETVHPRRSLLCFLVGGVPPGGLPVAGCGVAGAGAVASGAVAGFTHGAEVVGVEWVAAAADGCDVVDGVGWLSAAYAVWVLLEDVFSDLSPCVAAFAWVWHGVSFWRLGIQKADPLSSRPY